MSPKAAEFALMISFMSSYPEVLTLKVSQRSKVLGKGPGMSGSLVKGGSPDPETSPGQGGVFVLSVQLCEVVSGFTQG